MPMISEQADGVYVIAVTPFTEDGGLDLQSTDSLVDFYLEKGATGLTVLGMMGEAPKLTAAESRIFVRHVLARVGGRVPVVVGVTSPGLAAMKDLSAAVMDDGAAGVMVAPPPTVGTDDQILVHYGMVAETLGSDTPFVLQDFPLATGVQIAPSVILRLVRDHPNLVMLKHEDWPGLAKLSALRDAERDGARRIAILVGNGGLFIPEELTRGADGAMTGFAYPEMMVEVWRAHASGDVERAHDLFDAYLPLARYEQQPGPGLAIRKYLLARRGVIGSAALRRPGAKLSKADVVDIELLVRRQERRLREIA
ncbi:dihydrodipicolinate synthase family protein [Methylobacterium sp. ARG-1]|uniref:dihydrodipicolinate synthase family protein n=1 Tax=Methylobacterium sp. ARG-1 TaxID=1692501 RepID=UPI0006810D4B|nr:dihydrodipicolinate synthase family protein [Methylobacterium sp. ARG-1]KNY24478.1 dihydrodipicolinate synthetase [Methylobacterium sp. ARG-1]